jgi:ferric-dicitrate binding protein FerR (iron transport regulator)
MGGRVKVAFEAPGALFLVESGAPQARVSCEWGAVRIDCQVITNQYSS